MDRRPTRDLSTASGRYTIHDKDPSDRTELWETFCTGHGTWFPIAPSAARFKTSLSGAQCAGGICPSPCDLRASPQAFFNLAEAFLRMHAVHGILFGGPWILIRPLRTRYLHYGWGPIRLCTRPES